MSDVTGAELAFYVAALLILGGYPAALTLRIFYVEAQCLELGYAEAKTAWTLTGYCIKRDYRGEMFSVPLERARDLAERR